MRVNTNTLMSRIIRGKNFRKFIENNDVEFEEYSISEYLDALCKEYDMVPGQVIKKAQIDRTYGHQIFNGTRNPSRDKLIQIAIGFGLSLEETQRLLKVSGKSMLYAKIKRDAVCIYAISHNIGVMELQEMLSSVNMPMLGED